MNITPEHVHQLAQLAFWAGTGVVGSIVHSFIKRDGWSPSLNNVLSFVYCLLIALLDLFVQGKLDFTNYVAAFVAIYGAAQGWYSLIFVLSNAEAKAPVSELPVVPNP